MSRGNLSSIQRHHASAQRGMVLITTLVMLVLLTLFVISGIRLSNINLQIVGNYQWQREMEMLTDSALEQVISSVANFADTAAAKDICQDGALVVSGGCALANPKIGTVSQPHCTNSETASGYTKKLGELAPEDNIWVLDATATDSLTGARVRIHRGITVRQLAGSCPA